MKSIYRHINIELEYIPKQPAESLTEDIINRLHENRFSFKHYAVARHTVEEDNDDE